MRFPRKRRRSRRRKTFGDWTVYEERDFDSDPPLPTGVADSAITKALSGRSATLSISCGRYTVGYTLNGDDQFDEAMRSTRPFDRKTGEERIFAKNDKYDMLLMGVSGAGGYRGWEFSTFTEPLVVAGKYTICPVNDEKYPACLTFSLRGFTAALKAICPKR